MKLGLKSVIISSLTLFAGSLYANRIPATDNSDYGAGVNLVSYCLSSIGQIDHAGNTAQNCPTDPIAEQVFPSSNSLGAILDFKINGLSNFYLTITNQSGGFLQSGSFSASVGCDTSIPVYCGQSDPNLPPASLNATCTDPTSSLSAACSDMTLLPDGVRFYVPGNGNDVVFFVWQKSGDAQPDVAITNAPEPASVLLFGIGGLALLSSLHVARPFRKIVFATRAEYYHV